MIGVGLGIAGKSVGVEVDSARDRNADAAVAAQDSASESISAAIAAPSALEALLARPGALDRFERKDG